jgi:hypothetical protein
MTTLDEIAHAAAQQGWRLESTKDGLMLYPPDRARTGVLVHRNPTEQALKKTLSQLRRRGFVWPWPPKG